MTKMKPDIKKRWVEALRSGRYKQGRGMLRDGNKYCCLGVLCRLAEEDGVRTGAAIYYPGPYVREWAGLETPNPELVAHGGKVPLARLNDKGLSFREIADAIEEQL